MIKSIIASLLLLLTLNSAYSQYNGYYHELGIMTGPVFFQSDFGEKGNIKNALGNVGFSIGVFYYISLESNRNSLAENFKLRTEVSFMTTQLEHHGKYVEGNDIKSQKLKAMRSKLKTANVGLQLEFYPWKTDDYNQSSIFSPYISLGSQLTSYSVKAYSKLGQIGTPITTPTKYIDGFKSDSGITMSVTGSLGTRIKLSEYHALIVDGRLQYYFTDWMDGMNPNRRTYSENKTNDWSATLNVGYVYYFN